MTLPRAWMAIPFPSAPRAPLFVIYPFDSRADAARLLFTVEDTGIGLDAAQLQRISSP